MKKIVVIITLLLLIIVAVITYNLFNNKNIELYNAKTDYQNAREAIKNNDYETAFDFSKKCDKSNSFCQLIINSIQKKNIKLEKSNNQFCHKFLNNFKKNENIKIIEPVVLTNNYQDKKLKHYFHNCSKLELGLKYVTLLPEGINDTDSLSPKEIKSLERTYYKNLGFRLYELDIDNQKQYLFYGSNLLNKKNKFGKFNYDYYNIIDLKNCINKKGFKTLSVFDYANKKPTGNYNGVIKYKNKYYFYSIEKVQSLSENDQIVFKNLNQENSNDPRSCVFQILNSQYDTKIAPITGDSNEKRK